MTRTAAADAVRQRLHRSVKSMSHALHTVGGLLGATVGGLFAARGGSPLGRGRTEPAAQPRRPQHLGS